MANNKLNLDEGTAPEKKKDQRSSSLFIGSAAKVFQVLHAFDGPNKQMPLSAIALTAGLDRSATQRVVYTLEQLGYLRRVNDTRDYSLTSKVMQFGFNYLKNNDVVGKAAPYLLEISKEIGETVSLHELDESEIVYVGRFPGRHLINVDIMVGTRLPAVITAGGTAILSRSTDDVVENVLKKKFRPLTVHSEVDVSRLRNRIRQARDSGYAIIANETVLGDISVASCITDERGVAVAGVSISVPASRWSMEEVEDKLATTIRLAATSLSHSKFEAYR
ncbi:IclR family transcriptional regulator [Agrobacterium rosae]|uniref:IclR family transcriptional regulator n=1 Tax=Agrobacterium rosae TaxID=1972867 RepID=UPI00203360E1